MKRNKLSASSVNVVPHHNMNSKARLNDLARRSSCWCGNSLFKFRFDKLAISFSNLCLYLLLLLFPLGHLTRIQPNPNIAFYPHDLIIALFNFNWLIKLLLTHKKFTYPFWKLQISFLVIASLSWLYNYQNFGNASLPGLLYLLRFINFSLLVPSAFHFFTSKKNQLNFPQKFLPSFAAIAVFGLIQYVFLPDTRFLYQYGWDDHLNRLIGTFFDPGFTGILLILGYILAAYISPKNPYYPALFLVTIALTYSRAAFLTLTAVLLIIGALRKNLKQALSRLLLFAILVILLPRTQGDGVKLERTYSVTQRVESGQNSLNVFKDNWLIGVGFNNYRLAANLPAGVYPTHANSPDNSYLFLLATVGVIGTVIYLLFLAKLSWWSFRFSPLLFISLAAVLIHSFTNNTLFHPFVMIYLGILISHELSKKISNSTI